MYAAVGNDTTVVTNKLPHVELIHHLGGDPLAVAIAGGSFGLTAKLQCWQNLQSWALVADGS